MRPVFAREIVTSSRQLRYSWLRVGYASLLSASLLVSYLAASDGRLGDSAIRIFRQTMSDFFDAFCWVQLIMVAFLTPAVVSGAVASERERRTMEYLLASSLADSEIVVDKLVARFIQVVALVAAGLPVMAIATLIGGISPWGLLVVTAVTVSSALMFSAISILVSVWSGQVRTAMARTYFVLFVLFLPSVVLRLIPLPVPVLARLNFAIDLLLVPNPFWFLAEWSSGVGTMMPALTQLWKLCAAHIAGSMMCVMVSIYTMRRAARAVPIARSAKRRWYFAAPGVWDPAPLLWKEFFVEGRITQLGPWGTLIVAIGSMSVMVTVAWVHWSAQFRTRDEFAAVSAVAGTAVGSLGLMAVAARAAGVITGEKQQSSWLSLLSTPLTPRAIVWSKVIGNVYACRWLFFVLCWVWSLPVIVSPRYALAAAGNIVGFVVLMFAASVLGVFFSMWCSNSLRSIVTTVVVGIGVTVGYLFVTIPIGRVPDLLFAPCVPFLLGGPLSWTLNHFVHQSPDPELIAAMLIGYLGYGVAAIVIAAISIARFKQFTGRM